MSEIGRRIKALRQRSGLTQEELADRSSLSERSLRDLELGRVKKPRAKSIRLIASALELSADETRQLLGLIVDETPEPPAMPPPVRQLDQLPLDDKHFTGRFAELRDLDLLISERPSTRIVTISAIGGSGKTALAIHWAHGAAGHFPDGRLYVDLRGFTPDQEPLDPAEALGRILTALEIKPADQPPTLEERATLYRSVVAGRRLLVILDNAATADQVRPLLPGSPSCATIVTSRERLPGLMVREGAHPLLLDAMTESEAGELLRTVLGNTRVDEDRTAAAEIISLCGRLPLALRVAGASISLGDYRTLRQAADELGSADRLERLSLPGDPTSSVLPAFELSFARLPGHLKEFFGRLGLLPGSVFRTNAAASLTAISAELADQRLQRLVALNLVQSRADGRFALHDLVKLFAQRCAAVDEAVLRRVLDYYLQSADEANRQLRPTRVRSPIDPALDGVIVEEFATADAALRWSTDELPAIADAVEVAAAANLSAPAIQLPTSMIDFFHLRKHWPVWLATHETALEVARRIGDREHEGILLSGMGIAYLELGRIDEATKYQETAALIAREGDHRFPLARALTALGILAMHRADYAAAVEHFAECERLAAEDQDPYGAMLAVFNTAYAHLWAENFDDARALFEKALPMGEALGAADVIGGSINALALILQADGQLEPALDRFRQSAAVAEQNDNLIGLAEARGNIAQTLVALNRPAEARAVFLAALEAAEQLGDKRLQADLQADLDALLAAGTVP
ncbi:tetratricopeptide repeat protein [Kribbella sp. NPDC051718]|uniref:ATP-binding protein n=1 Tax=Kribbella sp. NPDC051718 TaxID=3155168 RepID=UPI00341C951F